MNPDKKILARSIKIIEGAAGHLKIKKLASNVNIHKRKLYIINI